MYDERVAEFSGSGKMRPFKAKAVEDLDTLKMLGFWEITASKFRDRLTGVWTEELLDSRYLPHPLLGKLVAREMMYFIIHHTKHHLDSLDRKVQNLGS